MIRELELCDPYRGCRQLLLKDRAITIPKIKRSAIPVMKSMGFSFYVLFITYNRGNPSIS